MLTWKVVAALPQVGGQSSSEGFRLLGILSSVESLARAQQQGLQSEDILSGSPNFLYP
jgi:hypothetical protein